MAANSIASGHHCSLCRYRCCFAGFRTCDGLFGKFFSVFDLYHLASPILHPPVPPLLPSCPLSPCPLSPHSLISSPTAHSQPMSKWTSDRFTNTIHWVLVIASTALMIGGTVWAFLPGSGHGELET
ncbi:solute carrier family 32 (vesicular inhibitory amino acid transporter) [Cryptococcus neoformans A2-102-5]|nr:solute carrier family 32 (vesicular inhibitory amino acid transporter) [Cryptococcus neoformans var. grubii 125.91]OXG77752.1 solute carrier family 32 (vesicular inhibitory amino acid transporter) [Cryptococcus neoformans var. grubii D17-1]OXG91087.1 solute carrier family 32 (vesicular inhibitory amino acid transporter) [Cryptococcus neoformans var. grubii A2-102-5]